MTPSRNFLSLKTMRKDAISIFYSGLSAVKPQIAMERFCKINGSLLEINEKTYDLANFENIWIIGAGKAAASMATAMEALMGSHISGGHITVKYNHISSLDSIRIGEAGHPVPDENGVNSTEIITEIATKANKNDLVICLLSGGGSALLPMPANGLTLSNKQDTVKSLLACGADIHEINTIRKHISAIKGGQLARMVHPATLITMILSDVVGDDLDVIASGPTVPDTSTFEDCINIINKYHLENKLPPSVVSHIRKGLAGEVTETPRPDDIFFKKTQNVIIGSNFDALMAAEQQARDLGYNPLVLSSQLEGDTTESAKLHCAIAKEVSKTGHPIKSPACILSGGETTVKITGTGLGGRNQEFALVSAFEIQAQENMVVLSAGTDGTDGPTDAAGAIVDPHTLPRALAKDLNPQMYLSNNDSYHFFKHMDDLLITGPTLTNVMDLRIMLIG